jgi:hypothetical protein
MTKCCLLFVVCAAFLFAQSDTASLSGNVSDPSGASVVGAKVSLRNLSTGSRRLTVSDIQGAYHFSLLVPGPYEITVEAAGFSQHRDDQLALQVAQSGRLNIQLQVGSATESVEVKTTISPLNTDTVAQGTVVSQEKIVSLPLNGRQFLQLALLVPGANPGGRQVQQNQFRLGMMGGLSISGGRTNNTNFLLDGAVNIDPDYSTINYQPTLDTIQEFQVQTAMFGAEYGHAGGQVNVATKSGTNEVHGSAWDFIRNNKLDARPFNLPSSSVPKFQRNQFGATLGAPIARNKLFAFGSYEGLRVRQAAAGLTTVAVPTVLQRAGNFSATRGGIFDPDTLSGGVRQQFPNNVIPASRINPLTLAAMNAIPVANVPGSTNQFVNASGVLAQNNDNYSGRIDFVATRSLNLFGRYSMANEKADIPSAVTGRDNINDVRPQNAVIGATTLLRNDLVNDTRVAFSRFRQLSGLPELSFDINGQRQSIPQFIVSGYPAMGGAGQYTGTTGGGLVQIRNNTFQIYDNLFWQRGRHSLKFGAEVMEIQYNRWEVPSSLGNFTFNSGGPTTRTATNDGTGDILASMLLGIPQIANRTLGPDRINGRQYVYSGYVQDNFRLRPTITLNLGIRYELAPPLYDVRNGISSIDYSKVPSPGEIFKSGKTGFYTPTLFVCGQSGYPKGCSLTDYNNLAPRVGFTWAMSPKTVLRAGGGIYFANSDLNGLFRLAAGLPNNLSQALTFNAFTPTVKSVNADQVFGSGVVNSTLPPVQAAGIDINQRTSYSAQWTMTIQRELRRDTALEIGYIGSSGVKLEQNVQPNNALPAAGAIDPRRPFFGLTYAPGMQFPYYLNVVGNVVPAGFLNYLPHSAQSNYESLFVRVEKRFSGGLSWLSSYTFSKAITNAPQFRNAGGVNGSENSPAQNSFNLAAERGLAPYDARHRLVNTYVYDLPFGRGHRWLTSGPATWFLGGWQTAGIVTLQSGFPFTVNLTGDTANVGAGTGGIFVRPNGVPGVDWKLPRDQRTAARYFNTAAFAMPAQFTFGNVGRNTVIGPGPVNVDLTMGKFFKVNERMSIQFRGEFFNAFNHPNFSVIGRIINTPATFGQALSQLDPRQLQFGVKVIY